VAGRNFANKLWNIARFVEADVRGQKSEASSSERSTDSSKRTQTSDIRDLVPTTTAEHWILRELNAASSEVAALLEEYRFSEAFEAMYHTIWDKVADWYLEASKSAEKRSESYEIMQWVLKTCLKIAHPFAPFVTEVIWQTLESEESMLITSSWPQRTDYDEQLAESFEVIIAITKEVREIVSVIGTSEVGLLAVDAPTIVKNAELICGLAKIGFVEEAAHGEGLRLTSSHQQVWLQLSEEQVAQYRGSLEKKLIDFKNNAELLEKRLANQSYVKNAPEALVAESREELGKLTSQIQHLTHQLKHL
jgi:valyl-tRNA synthetase